MTKYKLKILTISLFLIIGAITLDNNRLTKSYHTISNKKIPAEFNNFKILQISDFHNKDFPEIIYKTKDDSNKSIYNPKLIDYINDEKPDIIVITGDTIDSRKTNEDVATDLVKNLLTNYPVYYVTGNHEIRSGTSDYYKEKFRDMGVHVLANQSLDIIKLSSKITISGIDDSSYFKDYLEYNHTLSNLKSDNYNILLSHRPKHFDIYASIGFDLIFSGHTHGGQIRLPFIGGILSPDQGFFPDYDSGSSTKDQSTMIVSRGLGNSLLPLRINNPPELVIVTLKSK